MKISLRINQVLVFSFLLFGIALGKVNAQQSQLYGFFGDAILVSPGNASPIGVRAKALAPQPGYAGIDFSAAFPNGLRIADLNYLATDYKIVQGGAAFYSPAFVALTYDGSELDFYVGPYNAPADNIWHTTPNLASPTSLVDAQGIGLSYNEPYANVQALYGNVRIQYLYVQVVGYFNYGFQQVIEFDNSRINNLLFNYEFASGNQCLQHVEQQKRDFEARQHSDKRFFLIFQGYDRVNFLSHPHTQQEIKAFEDKQKADKKAFEAQQKADKEAFEIENNLERNLCKQITSNSVQKNATEPDEGMEKIILPQQYKVSNYPNPFKGSTKIKYELPFDSKVTLNVYDQYGRLIAMLVNGDKKAGIYTMDYNASKLGKGILYYKIVAESGDKHFIQTNKMVVVE